jgi:DNA-binding PadR family transcriptional regulator
MVFPAWGVALRVAFSVSETVRAILAGCSALALPVSSSTRANPTTITLRRCTLSSPRLSSQSNNADSETLVYGPTYSNESYKADGGMALTERHVVLGLVAERPGYGYAILMRMQERFGTGGNGIYQALDKLADDGLLRRMGPRGARSESSRAAPKPMYEATADGRRHLHNWIMESSVFSRPKQELDVKISFSTPLHWPRLIEQLRAQALYCLAEVNELNNEPLAEHDDPSVTWPEADAILQRKARVTELEGRIEWCQHAAEMLEGLLKRTPKAV